MGNYLLILILLTVMLLVSPHYLLRDAVRVGVALVMRDKWSLSITTVAAAVRAAILCGTAWRNLNSDAVSRP